MARKNTGSWQIGQELFWSFNIPEQDCGHKIWIAQKHNNYELQ